MNDFIICIGSQEEWTTAWNKLTSAGFSVSRNLSELTYRGKPCYIKHTAHHNYIWTSTMFDDELTRYDSFASFCRLNGLTLPPTMDDAIRVVILDQELGQLQAVLHNAKQEVERQEAVIAAKQAELIKAQEKLGIK